MSFMKTLITMFAVMPFIGATSTAATKTLIDYFLPTPMYDKLSSTAWGAAAVGPRDMYNGLEDTTIKQWCYWDGKIIKGPDGKYHMFASRWAQSNGHGGWGGSVAVHAVADKPTGPYVDKGLCWPDNQNGKGHNVTAAELLDGSYAIIVSDTRPGDIFTSKSLDGPWAFQGSIKVDANGFSASGTTANLSLIVRPDGSYLIAPRSGAMMLSTSGILGPYKVQGPCVYPNIAGLSSSGAEDPVVWQSGGLYHIVVNWFSARKAYHLTSADGINNWTNRGLAYDPTANFIRYTDGTVNHWYNMERPGVLIENGHVTHFTFAVTDVPKSQEGGNDTHGSKIVVVPFDGVAFDGGSQNLSNTARSAPRQAITLIAKGTAKTARITFAIPAHAASGSALAMALYDMKGNLIAHEYKGPASNKSQEISFDLERSVSPGVYCITLRYGKDLYSGRITIQ
jgi:hypothetical protein